MVTYRNELAKKILQASDAGEIMKLFEAEGEKITAEQAVRLFEKAQKQKEQQELSLDELESVSGGSDRDWIKDGCAATVEINSWCGSNDMCYCWDVTYDNPPVATCEKCGGLMVYSGKDNQDKLYTCVRCGYVLHVYDGVEFDV